MSIKINPQLIVLFFIIVGSIVIAYLLLKKTRNETFNVYDCNKHKRNYSQTLSDKLYDRHTHLRRPETITDIQANNPHYDVKEKSSFDDLKQLRCTSC